MDKIKQIQKARKKMKSLMIKQDKVFIDLLDKISIKEPKNAALADKIFDYLYNGTAFSLQLIKQELKKRKPKSWWHR